MFSRSFAKSSRQSAKDIAARAAPTQESVLRSPACSGEHNYTYRHTGFRTFQYTANPANASTDIYLENLTRDFNQVYEQNITTLPYHAALTALHHATASKSVATFLNQPRITQQLIEMHNIPAPAPAPAPEPTCFAKARQQLAKMKFELPPPHPRRTIVYRTPDGYDLSEINTSFDPTTFASSARNTFVKTCCRAYNSVHVCRCFKWCSRTSVTYVNEKGESIHVYYLSRKTDYQNLTKSYPMSYQPDEEHIPCSPREDVSDSDLFPWDKDYAFEEECGDAYCAKQQGFTHVWSSKRAKYRHLRRQRRQQQLASGELPEHGLIIVTFDIDEVWPVKTPLSLHAQYRRLQREKFEELQQHARFYESWYEETYGRPEPEPAPPAPPAPQALPAANRAIQHEKKDHSVRYIQRPLINEVLTIAHAASRSQVTEISALKPHQRTRLTANASLTALLAIRLGSAPGIASSIATTLYHDAIQLIVRRATGSEAAAKHITASYIPNSKKPLTRVPANHLAQMKQAMVLRFDQGVPKPMPPSAGRHLATFPEDICGPLKLRQAKYYAEKCLELIGNPNDPISPSAAKWAHLHTKVKRARRGEIGTHDIIASPDYNDWVYAIHYTYVSAVRLFLGSADEWNKRQTFGQLPARHRTKCWHICKEIRAGAPKYVQVTLMIREMYRFLIKTHQLMSPEFMDVFGLDQRYVNTIIARTKHLAYEDGDEASALMFGFLMPSMMNPDIHLDVFVSGQVYQHPDLYVKMSDPVFGPIKKQFRDMIPSRHTGTIDRATLMEKEPRICRRA
jgi:hypothetical protein